MTLERWASIVPAGRRKDSFFGRKALIARRINILPPQARAPLLLGQNKFFGLSRAAERLHWNDLNADRATLRTSSGGRLARVDGSNA